MFVEWITRLLGLPADAEESEQHQTVTLPPGITADRRRRVRRRKELAGSRLGDRPDVFDPRRIAEYDLKERVPLSPNEAGQLEYCCARVRARCEMDAEVGLALPHLAHRLIERISQRDLELNDLVQLVQQDPIVSANVLRAANSEQYRPLGEVRGIRAAVLRIGVEAVRQIAMVTVVSAFTENETVRLHRVFAPYWTRLRVHALATAAGCGWLAMWRRRGDVERAFLSGLLHDVGKFFALRSICDLVLRGEFAEPSMPLMETALEELHVDLGTLLCERWHLPAFVLAACRDHHPEGPDKAVPTVQMVRVVSGLDEIRANPWHRESLPGQVLRSAAVLEINAVRMRALFTRIQEGAARAEEL